MATRDLTRREFDIACGRRNYRPTGVLGYYELPGGVSVSVLNAGDNRRAQLAYLIRAEEKHRKRQEARA